MKRLILVYKVLNVVALLSMVFGLVPPAAAASISQVAMPTAPSERARDWPVPELAAANPISPFPDPATFAIEKALGGVVDSELLDSGSLVGLEPLTPNPLPSANSPLPSVSPPTPVDPLAEISASLPQPNDLAAFANRAEAIEEALDSDGLEKDAARSESTTALTSTDDTSMGSSEDTPAAIEPALAIPDTIQAPVFVENVAASVIGQLASAISETIRLPIIILNVDPATIDSSDPSNPSGPIPSDDVTITPEEGGTLISTDGLVRVDVPPHAVDAPFTLHYSPPQTEPQQSMYGFFTLESETADGKPVILKRAAHLSMRLPEHRTGRPLVFRFRAEGQQRTVSIGAYVAQNPFPTFVSQRTYTETVSAQSSGEKLATYIYAFGQFTFAALDDDGENPDENDDGLVITEFCWEPGEQGLDYTFAEAIVYTSTEEADPWGELDTYWDEEVDGEIVTQYKLYFYDEDKRDFSNEPEVRIGYEEIGPHELGTGITFTARVYDYAGPDDGGYLGTPGLRFDTLEDGRFQAGTQGCVSGTCEAVAPTISYVDIWQSGGQAGVMVAASDNSGEPSVSLNFNGQTIEMQSMGDGTFGAIITDYPVNQENIYQVTATDDCGNTTTYPEIGVWGSEPGQYGSAGYNNGLCSGYQMPSGGAPVNPSSGNFYERTTDISVAGVGNTDLIVERAYNSMAPLWTGATTMRYTFDGTGSYIGGPVAGPPQYFGPGWTFPFATYLLATNPLSPFDAPLYIQIQYADGHTVDFIDQGGVYVPDSPTNFDTLTKEGFEYVLRHKRTLEVERFNADGQLIAKEDRNGNRITLTYNGKFLTRVENDSGRWLEFDYNAEGLIAAIRAPESKTVHYGYTDGLLTSFTNARGNTTTYAYNEKKQLTTITTPKGHTSLEQTYDKNNRVYWRKEGRAAARAFIYSDDGLTTTIVDSYGNTTVYTYNKLGQIIQFTDALNHTEEYAYDSDYNRIYYKDKEGHEWHYTYDDRGNRLTEYGPLRWHRAWEYNDLDLVTRGVRRVDGSTTRQTTFYYDGRGNLIQTCNAFSDCGTIIYDGRGLPIDLYDFAGNHTHNTYDAEGDLIAVTNAEGETTHFDHDGLGRMIEMRKPLGHTYHYAYNPNDNLVAVDGPLGYHLSYDYDPNNNPEVEIDPNGGEIHYSYDESENLVRVENQLGFATLYTYGAMNELTGFQDAEGRTWSYTYDAMRRIRAMHGPLDTHTYFVYDAVGNATDITDPEGYVTHTEYDALDRPVAVTLNYRPGEPANADTNVTTTYKYDLLGNVLCMVDPEGNPTVYEYDLLGRMTLERDAEGQEWRYQYGPMGNLTLVINPRGYEAAFGYDSVYRLHTITDSQGHVTTFLYDGDGNQTDEIDPLGVVTHYDYNERDRLIRHVRNYRPGEPSDAHTNVTTSYEYDLAGNLRVSICPIGCQTQYHYDAARRLERVVDANGGITRFEYDRVDNLRAMVDANGHPTTHAYDDLNRRISVTNAEGHTVTSFYDKVGNLTRVVDANGNSTHFDLDALGRVTRMLDALNGEWFYQYDRVGSVLVETDANGHDNNSHTYDKVYRLLSSTDAEGHTSRFRWDPNGNLIEFVDGNGHSTTYAYDKLDHLAVITNAEDETTLYEYDPLGNQVTLIEADNTVTRYGYDPLYRLVDATLNYRPGFAANNDTNVVYHYTYDANGNLTAIADPLDHITHFEYDSLNRPVKETDPLGHTWEYSYDGVGNRLTRLDANGALTRYAYYPDDQQRRVDYADGSSVEYTYDPNNNRTSMQDWLGSTTWTYDALNRTTDVVDPFNRALRYGYDAVGNRIEMVYPDGNPVAYTYYKNDWMKTTIDPEGNVTSYERDGVGNITRIINPNSTVTEITYDRVDRTLTLVNRQTTGERKTNSAFAYTYNEVGHVVQVVNEYGWRNPPMVTENYTYDGLHRLAGMQNSDGVVMSYTYDAAGNRLTWATNDDLTTQTPFDGFRATYAYNAANQLTTAEINSEKPSSDLTVQFTYDANGNRINKLEIAPHDPAYGTEYTYDPENRLVVAQDYQLVDHDNRIDRAITTLEYDGGGRRLVKSYDPKVGGDGVDKRVEYVFDGLDQVAEYNMLNGQRENFYRGALGRIITMHHFPAGTQGQMYWYHYNFKGDVVGLTKHQGQSTHNYRYDPYGGVVPAHGNFTDPHNHYTLTGKEYDEHTGLVFFGARHYDPSAAVWQTQDIYRGSTFSPQSLHRYSYVYGNPISYYDPYGHWPKWLDDAVEAVGNWVSDTAEAAWNWVRDTAEAAWNWVEENQDEIIKFGITVAAIVGPLALISLCAATAGVGCLVGAALGAAAIGAVASYSTQVVDNLWQDGGWQFSASAFTNINWSKVAIDAVIAGVSAAIGGGFTKMSDLLVKSCTVAGCVLGIQTAFGVAGGALTQMATNVIDGDPCTGLFDNVLSAIFWGGVSGFASTLGSRGFRDWSRYRARGGTLNYGRWTQTRTQAQTRAARLFDVRWDVGVKTAASLVDTSVRKLLEPSGENQLPRSEALHIAEPSGRNQLPRLEAPHIVEPSGRNQLPGLEALLRWMAGQENQPFWAAMGRGIAS